MSPEKAKAQGKSLLVHKMIFTAFGLSVLLVMWPFLVKRLGG